MLIQLTLKEPVFDLTNDLKSWVKKMFGQVDQKESNIKKLLVPAKWTYCKYDWWL